MKQLNIKEYVQEEKNKLKTFAQQRDIDDKIKLGIIYMEKEGSPSEFYKQSLEQMGWKSSIYRIRENEKSCNKAIIRAISHKCTSIIFSGRENIIFDPYQVPRFLDCEGLRPDSLVNQPIPQGIIDYLKACEFPFSGKTAVVLGGKKEKEMVDLLLKEDMTVSICDDKSNPNIVSGLLCDADLVICAAQKPHSVVRTQCLNAVVVDEGINYQYGKLIGDFEERPEFCSDATWSISVDSGVDLLTELAFLKNIVTLTAERS